VENSTCRFEIIWNGDKIARFEKLKDCRKYDFRSFGSDSPVACKNAFVTDFDRIKGEIELSAVLLKLLLRLEFVVVFIVLLKLQLFIEFSKIGSSRICRKCAFLRNTKLWISSKISRSW